MSEEGLTDQIDKLIGSEEHDRALSLIEELPVHLHIEAAAYKCEILIDQGKYTETISYAQSVLEKTSNDNYYDILKMENQISRAYFRQDDYSNTELHLKKADDCYKLLTDQQKNHCNKELASSYNLKGNLFGLKFGDLLQALEFYNKALQLNRSIGYKSGISANLGNIALIETVRGDLDTAHNHLLEAQSISENEGIVSGRYFLAGNLRFNLMKRGKLEEALIKSKEVLAIAKEKSDEIFIANNLRFLVTIILDLNRKEEAKSYLEELQALASKNPNTTIQINNKLAMAYFFKLSTRAKNRTKAQELFEEIVYQDVHIIGYTYNAIINLLDILLDELKNYGEEEVLEEINHLVEKLSQLTEENNSVSSKLDVMIIKSKLALIDGDLNKADELLKNSLAMAKEYQLGYTETRINKEKKLLEGDLDKWNALVKRGASIKEKMDLLNYKDYISKSLKIMEM